VTVVTKATSQTNNKDIPLCVDLDGTLCRSDTLHEITIRLLKQKPWIIFILPFVLLKGKHILKSWLSSRLQLDPALLPYNKQFHEFLAEQHQQGRPLYLVTGAHHNTADPIAKHLGFFTQVYATDDKRNLTGKHKNQLLVEKFGQQGFDYAGNANIDKHIWANARESIAVNCASSLAKTVNASLVFDQKEFSLVTFARAIRVHQWAKNILLFIAALTSHNIFGDGNLYKLLLAFMAFSFCASFSYIINDLLDLDADRRHHTKKRRAFAAADISIFNGCLIALVLLGFSILICLQLPVQFGALVVTYFVLTNLYSFRLKSVPILDISVLAGLYTLRIIAGAMVIGAKLTFWLVCFSAFLFFSLAIVKRLSELLYLEKNHGEEARARGYIAADITTLFSLGSSSAIGAVLVLALYINSPNVKVLYHSPVMLWLLCPIMLLWLGRIWLITGRGKMHDDPVIFALKDKTSWLIFALGGAIMLSATFL
jgi:4-hydroxybenzoate polyprenyltransferase